MPIIVPTVFVYDHLALEERLEEYEGFAGRVQLDAADANFTVQPSLGVEALISQPTTLKRDVHLMVAEPVEWLDRCQEEAVDLAVGQIESMSSQLEFKKTAEALGIKWGLALDLETPVSELDWSVAAAADQLLIMTVRAGKEGQPFEPKSLEKVKNLREKGFQKEICVDGGIKTVNLEKCLKAGADVLAMGSSLSRAEDPVAAWQELNRKLKAYAV